MIEVAKQIILLMDHTKIGKVSFAKFAELSNIDICITDNGVTEDMIKKMEEKGISVYVVAPQEVIG